MKLTHLVLRELVPLFGTKSFQEASYKLDADVATRLVSVSRIDRPDEVFIMPFEVIGYMRAKSSEGKK